MPLPLCFLVEDALVLVSLLDDVLYETPPITTSLFSFCKQAVLGMISIMTRFISEKIGLTVTVLHVGSCSK